MDRDDVLFYGGSLLVLLLIAGTIVFYVQGSIVSEQKDEISFHMIPEGNLDNFDGYDPSGDYYVNGDSAILGDYKIELSNFGTRGRSEGCGIDVAVSKNGQEVISGEAVQAHSMADYGLEDKNLDGWTHDGYSFQFGNPFYMDATVYRGEFYGVNCGTTFSRIKMPVNWSAMDVEMNLANRTDDRYTDVEVVTENDWRPIKINGTVEACSSGDCVATDLKDQRVSSGDQVVERVSIPVRNTTSVSIDGNVYLDLNSFTVSGLSYDGRDAGEIEYIKIGSISGSDEVVEITEEIVDDPESPGDGDSVSSPDQKPGSEPVGELGIWQKFLLWLNSVLGSSK